MNERTGLSLGTKIVRILCRALLLGCLLFAPQLFAPAQADPTVVSYGGYQYALPLDSWDAVRTSYDCVKCVTSPFIRNSITWDAANNRYVSSTTMSDYEHGGTDLGAKLKTVYAIASGDIIHAGWEKAGDNGHNGGYGMGGQTLTIRGDDGYYYYYAHLNSFIKTSGHVDAGKPIAVSGHSSQGSKDGYYWYKSNGVWKQGQMAYHLHIQIGTTDPNKVDDVFKQQVYIKNKNVTCHLNGKHFITKVNYITCVDAETFLYQRGLLRTTTWQFARYGKGPSFTWDPIQVKTGAVSQMQLTYRCRVENGKGKVQELGCVLTSANGKTQTWTAPTPPSVTGNGIISDTVTLQGMGFTVVPGLTYACQFYVKYDSQSYVSQSKVIKGDISTVSGSFFTVTDEHGYIRDNYYDTGKVVYTADPGETFPILGSVVNTYDNTWYKVQYGASASKSGWIYAPRGSVTVASAKQVTLVNADLRAVPIHVSYYGDARLISAAPNCLQMGESVTVLGQYRNTYGNLWYYINDQYGHRGWVWSDYFASASQSGAFRLSSGKATLMAIRCPEPSENSVANLSASTKEITGVYSDEDAANSALLEIAKITQKILQNPIFQNGGGGSTGTTVTKTTQKTVTFTGLSFKFSSPRVYDTNAYIEAYAVPNEYPNLTCSWTRTGVRVKNALTGEELPLNSNKDENHSYRLTRLKIWFDITKELGVMLEPGTTYTYQFYTVCNGATYWSAEQRFTTTGQRNCTVSFQSNGGSAIQPVTRKYGEPMPLPSPLRSDYVFTGWYRDAALTVPFTSTSRVDADLTLYARWELEKPIVPVTGVTLDKAAVTMYADTEEVDVLTASVTPADATFASVVWSTSDPNVVNTDQYGNIVAIGPGSAVITCASASDGQIRATCQVTVRLRMASLYLLQDDFALYGAGSRTIGTGYLPAKATETAVVWSSSDPSVAVVDQNGAVTAVAPGKTTVTATAVEGGLSASCEVSVENALSIALYPQLTTLYRGGREENTVAFVLPTAGSLLRNDEDTYTWTVQTQGGSARIEWDEIAVVGEADEDGFGHGLQIRAAALSAAGTTTVTVTCQGAQNSETVSFDVVVEDLAGGVAQSVSLPQTLYELSVGESALIPASPAPSGGLLPDGLELTFDGGAVFGGSAVITDGEGGANLSFAESGVYAVDAVYSKDNICFRVPLTFRVADESGVVHLPAERIEFCVDQIALLPDDSLEMAASVYPRDAWNANLVWSSSDTDIASVDENGVVTALSVGSAVITASAADGFGAEAHAVVRVENPLQLEENEMSLAVLAGGDCGVEIAGVGLTSSSLSRAALDGRSVQWQLRRISAGSAHTVVALDGREGSAGLILQKVNSAGTDVYSLTCASGQYSDECVVVVEVRNDPLPQSVVLAQPTVSALAGETLYIDTTVVADAPLPEGTQITLSGSAPLMRALGGFAFDGTVISAVFGEPAAYSASLVFSGANYRYEAPLNILVLGPDGGAPVMPTAVALDQTYLSMTPGESAALTASVLPENADGAAVEWSSSNEDVATVSGGVVTAVAVGNCYISARNVLSDLTAYAVVHVEDGLTIADGDLELNVYVEGESDIPVAVVQLTASSSQRLDGAPQWRLTRLSGSGAALRVTPVTLLNADGDSLYAARIMLERVTTIGESLYQLTCAEGETADPIRIAVHAVNRDATLPASVTAADTVYTAQAGELILVEPELVCAPEGTELPSDLALTWDYPTRFAAALDETMSRFSRSVSTFVFTEPGLYQADMVLAASNVRYTIPVTFRVTDGAGNVPVNGEALRLSDELLDLVPGESAPLSAVFTPRDTTDQAAVWSSNAPSVASVDENGLVTAHASGMAVITCTPSDAHLRPAQCTVTVGDYLAFADATTEFAWYMQGKAVNAAGSALLTGGTLARAARDGLTPEWTLTRDAGSHAELALEERLDGAALLTTALNAPGEDTYTLTCRLGEHTASRSFTLRVLDLGADAPQTISIASDSVSAQVGQAVQIDFAPMCAPAGTSVPSAARRYYAGLGAFYEALDFSQSAVNDASDTVTVAFTRPGVYLLARYWLIGNLRYAATCRISVGEPETDSIGLLEAESTDCAVYFGGKAGEITALHLTDATVASVWGEDVRWSAAPVGASGVTAVIEPDGLSAHLYVVDAGEPGESVWRVSCAFGSVTESVDITIRVLEPLYAIPDSIALVGNRVAGAVGEPLSLPLGVLCEPAGSRLPSTGSACWSLELDGRGAESCSWSVSGGRLKCVFARSGYYTGWLRYGCGNLSYALPVYFEIQDADQAPPEPALQLYLVDAMPVLYPEGETGVAIGAAVVNEGQSAYAAGSAASYMSSHDVVWTVSVDSDAAVLSLAETGVSSRALVIDSIAGTGDVLYTVRCTVNGRTFEATGSLHIARDDEARPEATLRHGTYRVGVGESVSVDRRLYSKADGSLLQSASVWNADALLSAIGYHYDTDDAAWTATFYKAGTYHTTVTAWVGNLAVNAPLTVIVGDGQAENVLTLPRSTARIEDGAFMGSGAEVVDLRGTRVAVIGRDAFRDCIDLVAAYLPDTITQIGDGAFSGCLNLTIHAPAGSVGAAWAAANGIPLIEAD